MKSLPVINPHAAGIDVGSEKLHTSIAGDEPVVFGTFTNEVYRLRDHFLKQGVETVAMEATGVYWLYVFEVLEAAGIEKVMEAILTGERDPERLLDLCDEQIKKKKRERVIESLRGTWREEHLFALGQAVAAWKFYQQLLVQCDRQVERVLKELAEQTPPLNPGANGPTPPEPEAPKRLSKNAPQIEELHQLLKQVCGGGDVTAVAGIADGLLVQLIAETGTDRSAWKTEKDFTIWLGLSPGTAQSGKRKGAVKRQCNRAGRLFRLGARSLARRVDKALGGFFRRLKKAKGGLVATKAVARKIALLYYRTIEHGLAYVEKGLRQYEMQYEESQRRLLAKLAAKQGFKLMSIEAEKLQSALQSAHS